MLDGAPGIGEVEDVVWYTPQQVAEIRHQQEIARRLDRRPHNLGFKVSRDIEELGEKLKQHRTRI